MAASQHAGRPAEPEPVEWASRRLRHLDNLKVVLIAGIIAGHAVIGYSEFDWWSYSDVREVTLSPVTVIALMAAVVPFAVFAIPVLFLVAGLLTPASVERKGPAAFLRDRLVRLGVPFVVFALLLWPILEYALFRFVGTESDSYGAYLRREGSLDTGVFWFVGVLLLFSAVYAGWVWVVRRAPVRRGEIDLRSLLVLGAAVALATFLVRLAVPMEGDNRYVDLNLFQWPACAALFGLGIAASRRGWTEAVPDRLRRQARTTALVAVGAMVALGAFATSGGDFGEVWMGGPHWQALGFASVESALTVFGSVWLLGAAQRRLDRPLRWAGPAVARSAYGAFMLQGPVLIGLALALRPLALPAEFKALAVATASVAASFGLAWLLVSRVRAAARIL